MLLETFVRTVLVESTHDLLGRGAFQIGMDVEKELVLTKSTARWRLSFEAKHQIVQRKQLVKLISSL
jgi:hypothetical protein